MGFRRRLALFLVVTLVAVQVLTAVVGYAYLRFSLVEKEKRELFRAAQIFTRQLELLSDRVTSDVKLLSLDYALRQAIAQRDEGTEVSALRNHGRRVGATRMVLVGLDGRIAADTAAKGGVGESFPYPDLLNDAANSDEKTALAGSAGHVDWVVVVAVRAPITISYIAAFIPVGRDLLDRLRQISTVPRSIALASENPDGSWSLDAQTDGTAALALPSARLPLREGVAISSSAGTQYLTVTTRLATASTSAPVVAVLGRPLDEALATYRSSVWPMLGVLIVALLAALGGAIAIVRGFARPIESLARAARRIAAGDYTPSEPLPTHDEIGHLSDALVTMARSISEREEALKGAISAAEVARLDAERANRAKSAFLSNMSHELRTPLNAIVGFGEMIEHQVLGPLNNARYLTYARDIGTSAQRLLALVSRMLDVADVESGRLAIARDELALDVVVRHAVSEIRQTAECAGVSLSCSSTLPASERLVGDATKLGQALAGLIDNAVKFTPKGGRVAVSLGVDGAWQTIRIEDTGIGISNQDLETVTRPFHRLNSAFDGDHQGAGLGLPFAKAIVELHGGRLEITSAIAEGTEIRIALPRAAQSRADAA